MREAGISPPFVPADGQPPPFGTPDGLITTHLDVSRLTDRKRRALRVHASQLSPDFFVSQLSPALFHELFAIESFRLITNLDPAPAWADALFGSRREASRDHALPR